MKGIINILLLTLLFWSCQTDLVDAFTYEFSPPKISIAGELVANEVPSVLVTRTLINTDTIFRPEYLTLRDAIVILSYENYKDTLEYEVATNFFKGKNKIQSGKYYSIHVNHPKYGAAYAQDIYIPQPFTIKAANLIKTGINNTKICGTNEYEDLMASFSISFGEFQEDSTYFNYIEFANTNICASMNFNFDKYICELVKGSRYFNRSCLGNENVFRYNAIGPALERKKNITCIIGIYSKENYKRAISSEERLGVEIGLLEKVTAYSNVVNGYGIVYGSFKTQITIEN